MLLPNSKYPTNGLLDKKEAVLAFGVRKVSNLPFLLSMLGASTGDPTHDEVMRRGLMGKASQASGVPLGSS